MISLTVKGYLADENGNIYSTVNRKNKTGLPFLMKPYLDKYGYANIVLRTEGKKKRYSVHRLVCEAFHGLPSANENICMHLNGNPSDNRPVNLKWGTQKENKSHEEIHGTKLKGSDFSWSKYSEDQIANVKALLVQGLSYREIEKTTGVDYQVVNNVAKGSIWSHIPFPGDFQYTKNAVVKLTESDVINIKEMLEQGLKPKEIADIFGVHRVTVSDIKDGRTWQSIN